MNTGEALRALPRGAGNLVAAGTQALDDLSGERENAAFDRVGANRQHQVERGLHARDHRQGLCPRLEPSRGRRECELLSCHCREIRLDVAIAPDVFHRLVADFRDTQLAACPRRAVADRRAEAG